MELKDRYAFYKARPNLPMAFGIGMIVASLPGVIFTLFGHEHIFPNLILLQQVAITADSLLFVIGAFVIFLTIRETAYPGTTLYYLTRFQIRRPAR